MIYALVDPRDGMPHYVGDARRPQVRLTAHVRNARKGNPRKVYVWLREVLEAGHLPILHVLAEEGDEVEWIAHGRATGWPLTNEAAGGLGSKGSPRPRLRDPEVRARAKASYTHEKRSAAARRALETRKKRS